MAEVSPVAFLVNHPPPEGCHPCLKYLLHAPTKESLVCTRHVREPLHSPKVVLGTSANRCISKKKHASNTSGRSPRAPPSARWLSPLPRTPPTRSHEGKVQNVTSKVSTGASKTLYQARPRIVAFFKKLHRVHHPPPEGCGPCLEHLLHAPTKGRSVCTRHVRTPLRFPKFVPSTSANRCIFQRLY